MRLKHLLVRLALWYYSAMAASENPALRFNNRLMGILFAICVVVFVIGLVVLPFATAIRLIGLAAIVSVPFLIALLKLDSSRHGPIAIFIIIAPGLAFVPRIVGEGNRHISVVFYCMTACLITLPLAFLICRRCRIWRSELGLRRPA